MIKTKQDNNMTYWTGAIYDKKEIELLWLIRSSVVCDENKTGQRRDQMYKCDLCRNRY